MIIAFWSNANEKSSVTANMAAISTACVIRYPYSVVMMENYLSRSNLRAAFYGRETITFDNEVGTNYYDGNGMEGLIRKIYRGDHTKEVLHSYVKKIIPNRLFYIPQRRVLHSEVFDYEFGHGIEPLLKMMEQYADISFIDTASHQNLSTKTILEKADLIVVNLYQNQTILENFFQNYSSLVSKSVFLINKYEYHTNGHSTVSRSASHTNLSCKVICRKYDLPLESLIAIPENELFQIACRSGGVKDFMDSYNNCGKESANYLFMHAIKKATYIILKRAVEAERNKEVAGEQLQKEVDMSLEQVPGRKKHSEMECYTNISYAESRVNAKETLYAEGNSDAREQLVKEEFSFIKESSGKKKSSFTKESSCKEELPYMVEQKEELLCFGMK